LHTTAQLLLFHQLSAVHDGPFRQGRVLHQKPILPPGADHCAAGRAGLPPAAESPPAYLTTLLAKAKAAEEARGVAEVKAAEDARRATEAKAAEDARRVAEANAPEDESKMIRKRSRVRRHHPDASHRVLTSPAIRPKDRRN
jgi:hypothetical protein